MKRNRCLLFLSVMLLAVVTGYYQGAGAHSDRYADLLPPTYEIPPQYPTQAPRPANLPGSPSAEQTNLLVVQVESLAAQPQPVSLWLVIHHNQVARQLTWIPIYRSGHDQATASGLELISNLRLTPDAHLDPAFLNWFANTYKTSLDGYLLVDTAQAAALIDVLGGVELDGSIYSGLQALELNLDSRTEDPLADLNLMRSICQQLNQVAVSINPVPLYSLVMNHLVLTSPGSPAPQVISSLLNTGNLTCRFPTLQEMVFAIH